MIRFSALFLAVLLSGLSSAYTPDPELSPLAQTLLKQAHQTPSDSYYYFVGFGAKGDPVSAGKIITKNNAALPNDQKLTIGTIPNPECLLLSRPCIDELFSAAESPLPDNTELLLTRLKKLTEFDHMHSAPETRNSRIQPDIDTFSHANHLVLLKAVHSFVQGKQKGGIEQIYKNTERLQRFLALADQALPRRFILLALEENLNVLTEIAIRTNNPSLFQPLTELTPQARSMDNAIAFKFGLMVSELENLETPMANGTGTDLKAIFHNKETINDIAESWQSLLGLEKTNIANISEVLKSILQTPANIRPPNRTDMPDVILNLYMENTYREVLAGELIQPYLLDAKISHFNAMYIDQNPTPANPLAPEQASIKIEDMLCAPVPISGFSELNASCLLLPQE